MRDEGRGRGGANNESDMGSAKREPAIKGGSFEIARRPWDENRRMRSTGDGGCSAKGGGARGRNVEFVYRLSESGALSEWSRSIACGSVCKSGEVSRATEQNFACGQAAVAGEHRCSNSRRLTYHEHPTVVNVIFFPQHRSPHVPDTLTSRHAHRPNGSVRNHRLNFRFSLLFTFLTLHMFHPTVSL